MKVETISISLTDKQTELLMPFLSQLKNENGMVIGQFHEATEGPGFFEVAFFGEEKGLKIQEALGGKPGTKTKKEYEVYMDVK